MTRGVHVTVTADVLCKAWGSYPQSVNGYVE